MTTTSIGTLSNQELIDAVGRAASQERCTTAELLALLAEMDARKLYLGEGCSSLFAYCTQVLHLSEHAAYHRIEAARAARRFPIILDLVADGSVTLTTVAMLRPHLTFENQEVLLAAARHKSKREVERQIACLDPKPEAKALIRRVPELQVPCAGLPTVATTDDLLERPAAAATTRFQARQASAVVAPLASDSYLLRVTLTATAHAKLRRAQDLLRHQIPSGAPADILEKALTLLVQQLEKSKVAKTPKPCVSTNHRVQGRPARYIPAAVRRVVWERDQERCAFVGSVGRCTETACLEFHHLVPFARGGLSDVANIALRCRAHNGYESEQVFGMRPQPSCDSDSVRTEPGRGST